MHVRILELDGGLDPDEYCKQHGAEAYAAKLDAAKNYFYWLADRARGKYDMHTAEGRVAGFQFLLPAVQRLSDKLERLAVVNDVAGYLGVDAGPVLESFRKAAAERREKTVEPAAEPVRPVERILLNLFLVNADARSRLLPRLKQDAGAVAVCHAPDFRGRVRARRSRQPGAIFGIWTRAWRRATGRCWLRPYWPVRRMETASRWSRARHV